MLAVPLSIAALLNALEKTEQDKAPLIPSCDYSVPLLFVVLLIQALAAIFVVYWFSKCCKCARTRKASRVATGLTLVMTVVYSIVIISFAVSVFVFVNKSAKDDTETNDQETEVCIDSSSPPFLFAVFYLLAFILFLILGIIMTCCDYHYKRTHRNFLRYLQDTVQVYENEGGDEEREETRM